MSIWEQNSEKAKQWLEKLLKLMAMPADVQIGVQELGTGPSSCWLIIDSSQLSPQQLELLLANKGEGLDAIQSLANTIRRKRFNHGKSRRGTRSPVSNSFKIRPKGGVKPALFFILGFSLLAHSKIELRITTAMEI